MEKTIESCARRILKAIDELGELNVLLLAVHLAERSLITYQALGWLAREGSVRYTIRASQVYVSRRSNAA